MILSKFLRHEIILKNWTACNIFVLNHTLNICIIHLNFSRVKLNKSSYWSVSGWKPEVSTECNFVLLGQVQQLHRHLLLLVFNLQRLSVSCIETAESVDMYQAMFKLRFNRSFSFELSALVDQTLALANHQHFVTDQPQKREEKILKKEIKNYG